MLKNVLLVTETMYVFTSRCFTERFLVFYATYASLAFRQLRKVTMVSVGRSIIKSFTCFRSSYHNVSLYLGWYP